MEKVFLSKQEKRILRLVKNENSSELKNLYSEEELGCYSKILQEKGLVQGVYASGGVVVRISLTNMGMTYFKSNPKLKNPLTIDKRFKITTAVAIVAILISVISLIVAITK